MRLQVACAVAGAACLGSTSAFGAQNVTVSAADLGAAYEGVGAVSGGGATSVLLHDYLEPQRSELLDYLFKPKFGAALQELYVEVGGDGNSTEGSEPSYMHTAAEQPNFNRGYEWWLMEQAKARNASILLDMNTWSVPGWVGNGNFWSQGTATYLANFLAGAKSAHNLNIDYIGCRNEKGDNEAWLQLFRNTLDNAGLSNVGIHAFDNFNSDWQWVADMASNAALRNAVRAVGNHTTIQSPPPTNFNSFGKPVWDTEEHVYEQGFQCEIDIVKAYIQNYVQNRITKTIYWYLLTAFYPVESFYDNTMALASSPWSGAYTIHPALWAYAHITQFAEPGWKFLNGASGTLSGGGEFVTLLSPNGSDFSVVAETAGASSAQSITFTLSGGLNPSSVMVWRSDATAQFVQQPAISVPSGSFTISMEPNAVYSITTTAGQQKGSAPAPPAAAAFPFPYYEDYDHYADFAAVGYRPYYHADIASVFELANRPDGNGQCLHQVIAQPPQSWAPESNPYTILGDGNWTDYEVSVDTMVESTGWASLMGRITNVGTGFGTVPSAYYLTLTNSGAWGFYRSSNGSGATQLQSGNAALASGSWHNLKLVFQGTSIKGLVDSKQVFAVIDGTYGKGQVGLGTQKSGLTQTTAYFDNLIVNSVGGSAPTATVFPQDGQHAGSSSSSSSGGSSSGSNSGSGGGSTDSGVLSDSSSGGSPDMAVRADASVQGVSGDAATGSSGTSGGGGEGAGTGVTLRRGEGSNGCSCGAGGGNEASVPGGWLGALGWLAAAKVRARSRNGRSDSGRFGRARRVARPD